MCSRLNCPSPVLGRKHSGELCPHLCRRSARGHIAKYLLRKRGIDESQDMLVLRHPQSMGSDISFHRLHDGPIKIPEELGTA
jgi:hypothetical protein